MVVYFLRTGGFTVLATKGVSTLLTMEWIKIFTEWITYPILAVRKTAILLPAKSLKGITMGAVRL